MSDKCCGECVFFKQKAKGYTCGTCDYPVPEWLRMGASGGNYISNEEYNGKECATFKSRADIVSSPAKD